MQITAVKLSICSFIRSLERAGVSAIIIEDKAIKNSLFINQTGARQDWPIRLQKK